MSSARSDNFLEPGSRIAERYIITDVLGEGGFATIYRGVEESLDRPVAIKVLNKLRGHTDAQAHMERFKREATVAAQLNHPNVVAIYAHGVMKEVGLAYIVMELLDGYDLDDELEHHGPLSVERTLRLMIPCLDAIGQGHAQGVIHKDLKPSNLFLVHPRDPLRESIRILDYGVAHIQSTRAARLTSDGMYMGTPQYMAPEYIKSEPITPALDVYQAGLLLVEMITGVPVVDLDDPFQCLMAHCDGRLNLPFELMATEMGSIIDRALARRPEDRYPNALALREALTKVNAQRVVDDIWHAREEHPDRVMETNPPTPNAQLGDTHDDEAFESEIAAALESITALDLPKEGGTAAESILSADLTEEMALTGPDLSSSLGTDAPSIAPNPSPAPVAKSNTTQAEEGRPSHPQTSPKPNDDAESPPSTTTNQPPVWVWAAAAAAIVAAVVVSWSIASTPSTPTGPSNAQAPALTPKSQTTATGPSPQNSDMAQVAPTSSPQERSTPTRPPPRRPDAPAPAAARRGCRNRWRRFGYHRIALARTSPPPSARQHRRGGRGRAGESPPGSTPGLGRWGRDPGTASRRACRKS
ncbi:MAG: protein kinase [Myxococcota bacterium]